ADRRQWPGERGSEPNGSRRRGDERGDRDYPAGVWRTEWPTADGTRPQRGGRRVVRGRRAGACHAIAVRAGASAGAEAHFARACWAAADECFAITAAFATIGTAAARISVE